MDSQIKLLEQQIEDSYRSNNSEVPMNIMEENKEETLNFSKRNLISEEPISSNRADRQILSK